MTQFTYNTIVGGLWWNEYPLGAAEDNTNTFFASALQIDATGEKAAQIGRYYHPSGGTQNIRKIHWRAGAIVSAGGSAIDISLQNVSNTAGPPLVPDETQDEKVSSVLLSSLSASTWNTTAALSADRSIVQGELISVVWEYDAAGRLGADSLIIATLTSKARNYETPTVQLKTGGTWAIPSSGQVPNIVFEGSDGTFAILDSTFPAVTVSSIAYNSGSAADEYALSFTVDYPICIDAVKVTMLAAASADFDIVLYNNTTALATVNFDANRVTSNSNNDELFVPLGSDIELLPGNTYYLSLKPTTANNVTAYYFDVNAVGHFDPLTGQRNWLMASRVDGGSWSNYGSSKRRMRVALRVSKIPASVPFSVTNTQLILPPSVIGY